jgi:hypothetical protein
VRRSVLIILLLFIFSLNSKSQADVSVICQDQWGAGRYNKVAVSVTFSAEGFARLTQEYPEGFEVLPHEETGCDVSWTGNRLVAVFMNTRAGDKREFTYLIKPETGMNGSFTVHSEITVIADGSSRSVTKLKDRTITVTGINGTLPDAVTDSLRTVTAQKPEKTVKSQKVAAAATAVYRVQFSASSKAIPEDKLRKDFKLPGNVRITVVRSGKTYKYRAGEFSDYESAAELLKELKNKGVKGAFVISG